MATLGQDDAPLVLGQSLSRGGTELRITDKGDLELAMDNKTVSVSSYDRRHDRRHASVPSLSMIFFLRTFL